MIVGNSREVSYLHQLVYRDEAGFSVKLGAGTRLKVGYGCGLDAGRTRRSAG